jgi:hypothetical protein
MSAWRSFKLVLELLRQLDDATTLVEVIDQEMRGLNASERKILARCLEGDSVAQVSKAVGCSQATVYRFGWRIVNHLVRQFEDTDAPVSSFIGLLKKAASVVPDRFPAVGTPEWGRMNRRRAELIRKKNRLGLTEDEREEYDRLQRLSHAALEEAFPRPKLTTKA